MKRKVGTGGALYPCVIARPWRTSSISTGPTVELVIAHLGIYEHYIRLKLLPGSPIPPIYNLWHTMHEDNVDGRDQFYVARCALWNS